MPTFSDIAIGAAVGAAVGTTITLIGTKGGPWLLKVYRNRYVEPKIAHQQFLLEQAEWFKTRKDKLRALDWELASRPLVDKFQLALLASKLDRHDQKWAMKITTAEEMRKTAIHYADMCQENADETYRQAEWINTHSLLG